MRADDVDNITEFIEHNEYGLAFENLCSQLCEYDIHISCAFYEKIASYGNAIQISPPIWLQLKNLTPLTLKFLTQKNEIIPKLSLVYREEDYSFDVEPPEHSGFTSVMINDLQLEIDNEGKIIYVWGTMSSYQLPSNQ